MITIFYNNTVIDAVLRIFNNRQYVLFDKQFLPIKLVHVIK